MNTKSMIRKMTAQDKPFIMEMMRVFYASPAVYTNGSEEIFSSDIDNCVNDNPYLEGYVIVSEDEILGYIMLAKSFSTEFGKSCIWLEDIYVKDGYRGKGLGEKLMNFVIDKYSASSIIRLEVEEENERALNLYKKSGFSILPYLEMKK